MTPRRAMFCRIASNIVTFTLLFNIFSVITHLDIAATGPGYLLMAVPFFLLSWLWRRIKNPHIFLLWLAGVMAAVLFASNFARTGAALSFAGWEPTVIFMVLISFRFIFVAITGQEAELKISTAVKLLIVHVALYRAVDVWNTDPALLTQISVTYLAMVLLILVCVHISNIEFMVLMQTDNSFAAATKALLSVNNRLIAMFTAAALIVGGLFAFVNPMGLVRWAMGGIMGGIRLLLAFLIGLLPDPDFANRGWFDLEAIPETFQYYFPEGNLLIYDDTPARMPAIAGILFNVIIASMIAACILALVYKVAFKERTSRIAIGDDTATTLETSFLEDLLGLLPRRRPFLHPIRRAYAKKVNQHIRAGIPISTADTTDAIYEKISPQEDIRELTAAYEQVRYGQE